MPKRERRRYPTNYPTDLTDEQWATIEPLVTVAPSTKGGRPPEIDRRAIVNALGYNNRTGCQWRLIRSDCPPTGAIRYSFDKWTTDGTFVNVNDAVRKSARKALGGDEEPSISVVDSQSTKTTEVGGERGTDGGRGKVNGRKRQFWVDRNGLLLRVLVHPANISDTEGAEWLLADHHQSFRRMQEIRGDEGYKQGLDTLMEQHTSIKLNVIEKPVGQKGSAVIPKLWVVERSIAWAGRNRLANRAYNRNAASSESCIYLSSIAMLFNRMYPRE